MQAILILVIYVALGLIYAAITMNKSWQFGISTFKEHFENLDETTINKIANRTFFVLTFGIVVIWPVLCVRDIVYIAK